jgi:acetate kinase
MAKGILVINSGSTSVKFAGRTSSRMMAAASSSTPTNGMRITRSPRRARSTSSLGGSTAISAMSGLLRPVIA